MNLGGSGVPTEAEGAGIWKVADGRLAHLDNLDRDGALAALRDQAAM